MLTGLSDWLVDPSGLTPHGFCLAWQPGLIWLHAASDVLVGLAYFSIPLALAYFIDRRRDIVFRPIFLLFAVFIVLCGAVHWLELLTLWVPAYGIEGVVKAGTAIASVLTAISLWKLMPEALLLPSPLQYQEVREALAEREQRALELSRLNADLDQFAYIASHDLKAPLLAINQLAAWIKEDIGGTASAETLSHLTLMQRRAIRLQMLISSLTQYARVGHDHAIRQTVDLQVLVHEISESLGSDSGFQIRLHGDPPLIDTCRAPLDHVLRNLISNAVKHHDRAGGVVSVDMQIRGGLAEFRVTDDGPGIAPEFHERIFAIFQTLQSRDEQESSGVGLAIVKKTVERVGGTVWVTSAPPRRGTVFGFTWPVTVVD